MPFESHPGLPGKVYLPVFVPEKLKKRPCKDCFSCQNCTDDRCKLCRDETGSTLDENARRDFLCRKYTT